MDALTRRPAPRRHALTLLLLAVALSAGRPAAAEVALGGYTKAFLFEQLGEPWALDRAGARLQLALRGGSGPVAFFGAVDFELDSRLLGEDQPLARGDGLDIYPVEIYLNISKGPIELRLGQQYIFWGRTTWVNPTDVITPWDYPNMASEIEDYRRAPLAARLNWYLYEELMLDLVWLPLFRPSQLGPTLPASVGGLPVIEGEPALPERRLDNGEFGLRLCWPLSRYALDWSISAYRGFEKLPVMTFAPQLDLSQTPPVPEALVLTRRYAPLTMVGLDLAKALAAFVFKGEAALKITDDWAGDDPLVRNSRVEAVAGVDYTVSQDLDLGLQYIVKVLLNYDPQAERAALAQLSGGAPPFVEQALAHELSLRVNARFIDTLGVQLTAIYSPVYNDLFAIGFVWWEIADALKGYLGAVAFYGAEEITPYGRQQPNSRLFAEIKYSF